MGCFITRSILCFLSVDNFYPSETFDTKTYNGGFDCTQKIA